MENKKKTNYIILIIVFLISIALVLYLCRCYKVYDEYQKQKSVISGTINEINKEDLEHFILDNPTTYIYICESTNDNCRTFEKTFKKLINKKELNEKIVYLNLPKAEQEDFIKNFNEKYKYKKELTSNFPAIISFEDGKVISLLEGKNDKTLTIRKVKQFFELNELEEQ